MKKTPVVLRTVATSCLILASACGQNAHVTKRTPESGAGAAEAQTGSITTPGTVSWTMADADAQSCPKSGEGVILKKFVDKNGNGKQDADEPALESKTICAGAVGARGEIPTLPPALLAISDATTDQCAEGGKVVEAYIDLIPNGKKDPQEPALTTGLICNGDRGDGTKFTVTDAATCPSGKGILVAITATNPSAPPPNPASMTYCEGPTQVSSIMPKLNKREAIKSEKECKFGGSVLELYYDANGNGRKDPLEFVASTAKFCKVDPATEVVIAQLSTEDRKTIDTLKTFADGLSQITAHIDETKQLVEKLAGQSDASSKDAAKSAADSKTSANASKSSADASKASADAAKTSEDGSAKSATAAAASATQAGDFKTAAEQAKDAAAESAKQAEASKLAADENMKAKVADAQGLLDQAKAHRDAAELAAQAAEAHRKAAEAAKDAAIAVQGVLDSAKAELEKLRDLAIAKADELAAAIKTIQDAPRQIDQAGQKALADLAQQVSDMKASLAKDVEGHKATLQQSLDAGVASLNAKMAELDAKGAQIQKDLDTKIAGAAADFAKAAEDAAKAKDEAAKALRAIADATAAGTDSLKQRAADAKNEITTTADAKTKEIQDLIAPLSGIVDQVKRLAEEVRQKAKDLPAEIQGYVDAAKKYSEQAQAASGQATQTIEQLQQKAKEAEARLQRLADQARANAKAGVDAAVTDIRTDFSNLKKSFEGLKSDVENRADARDAAVRKLIMDLKATAEQRLQTLEVNIGSLVTIQTRIETIKLEITNRIQKLEDLANNRIRTGADPCAVTRTLTDVSRIDPTVAATLELPYDRKNVEVRDYGSPGDPVAFTGDTMQIRLNRQELFQISTTGLPQLPASDLVEGSLKASIKLVLTKNMKDQAPYDYTEILCTLGDKRACTGERFHDNNFSKFIVDSFWKSIGGQVASSLLADKLRSEDKAEVRVFDLPGVKGVKYRAFKRTVELDLGQAFKGQADPYAVIYDDDGKAKPLLQFVIADDIRLYGVTLTVSYRTKSCSASR